MNVSMPDRNKKTEKQSSMILEIDSFILLYYTTQNKNNRSIHVFLTCNDFFGQQSSKVCHCFLYGDWCNDL